MELTVLGCSGSYGAPAGGACSGYLVRAGSAVLWMDCGNGSFANLQQHAAVEDLTAVVITHAHPDHLWGVLDDLDEPLFPGATHHIGQAEADFWMDPATVEAVGEARAAFAVGARNRLEAIADGINTFGDGDTVVPGVVARASFGHTPGHMSFLVNDAALVVGDAIGNGSLALVRPDLPYEADQDPETGVATRTAMLAELADTGLTTVGFHLPNRGLGRLEKNGEGYRFVAVDQ